MLGRHITNYNRFYTGLSLWDYQASKAFVVLKADKVKEQIACDYGMLARYHALAKTFAKNCKLRWLFVEQHLM